MFDIIFKSDKPVNAVPGGSTFNAMVSLGRCGIEATFLSETGADHVGDIVCSYLEANGVSAADVERQGRSHLSLAFLNRDNDAEYSFYKDHPNDKASMRLPEIHRDDILLLGSFYSINPMIRHKVKAILDAAKEAGAIIYYDINFRASHKNEVAHVLPSIEENFSYADIIRGSNEDFETAYGLADFESIKSMPCLKDKTLIYTCGACPTLLRTKEGRNLSFKVDPIDTVSTIGAGDNFNAGIVYSLLKGNVLLKDIRNGLDDSLWQYIITTGQSFSADCCRSLDNSISPVFAESLGKL